MKIEVKGNQDAIEFLKDAIQYYGKVRCLDGRQPAVNAMRIEADGLSNTEYRPATGEVLNFFIQRDQSLIGLQPQCQLDTFIWIEYPTFMECLLDAGTGRIALFELLVPEGPFDPAFI